MSVQDLLVVAAVPLVAADAESDTEPAFWFHKLFGSGRRRKHSRDIGTCITEEQLELESPPLSPRSPALSPRLPRASTPPPSRRRRRLPDVVTSCAPSASTGDVVFVFPPAERGTAELQSRLSSSPSPGGRRIVAGGGVAVSPRPPHQDIDVVAVGRCLRLCADEFELSRRQRRSALPHRRSPYPLRPETAAACGAVCAVLFWVGYRLSQ